MMPIGWSANPLTGKCEPARTHRCYDAYKPDFRFCEGYEDLGYFCVDEHCVGMNPIGDVERCAVLRPEGWTPDLITGKCAPDSKGVYYEVIHPELFEGNTFYATLVVVSVAGYFCGSIMGAYLLGRSFYRLDCRKHGTKNVGAINIKLISDSKKVFSFAF